MSDEPTKACVRVLTFEGMIRYYIWHALDIVLTKLIDGVVWVICLVNWCIARALARWFGIPVLIYWTYWFLSAPEDTMSFEFFTINIIPMAVLGCFILVSWVEVPRKERAILDRYSDYKEQQRKKEGE